MFARSLYFVVIFAVAYVSGETRVAIAHLLSQNPNISGTIEFTETTAGLRVTGRIVGLAAGRYGFHVHSLGDTSSCETVGTHFNPDSSSHGGREHPVRHVGDLGNVIFVGNSNAVAVLDFVDTVITLRGRNNILGRAVVLHEQEDDLGLGGHETSLTSGNAGPRVACGAIGIKSPADPWNSAGSVSPSVLLFVLTLAFLFRSM